MSSRFFSRSLLLWLAVLMASSGLAMPPHASGGQDQLKEMIDDGWVEVAPGVLQRQKEGHKVETFATGVEGFSWMLGQFQAHLDFLLDEYRIRPTAELKKTIRDQEKAIRKVEGYIQILQSHKSAAMTAETGCNFSYSAHADAYPATTFQGVRADADACFSNDCGYSGDTYANAFARATLNGTTTTVSQTDPDTGSSICSYATASVAGTANCYSYANVWTTSLDLELIYSVADENFDCLLPKDAQVVSYSVPATMVAGQNYAVSVTLKNVGSLTWSPVGPQCNAYRFGTANANTWGVEGGRVDLPGAVAPGQQVTLAFSVTAPATPGGYDFQWRMIHECVEWFGPTLNVPVTVRAVGAKDAVLVSQSVPASMVAGQSYAVSMTWKNVGTETWSPVGPTCGAYRLGTANANTWGVWGGRVELPGAVAPGQQVTLNFTVTAPATPGPYDFQWRMVQECVQWFGDFSPLIAVTVGAAPPTARFSFSCSGLACSFDASASTGVPGIASYDWNFGDFSTDSGMTAGHPFALTGAYVVTLKVTTTAGASSSVSRKVSVTDDPVLPAENYFTVAPCRLVDTRATVPLNSGQHYVFNVAGNCGIPATAKAVSFNVGVASATGGGNLAFYPGNQSSSPFATSTINFIPDPSPRFNNAVLRLATNGTGTLALRPAVFATPGQVHFILDVYGYFSEDATPAPEAQGPFGFETVTPCRFVDTRTASPLAHDLPRSFTVQGTCGVPTGTAVAVLNPVAVTPSEAGYIQVFQAGTPAPMMETLSFPTGIFTRANGTRVRLPASTPDVTVQFSGAASTSGTTHLILDVYGYFKSDAPLKYRPVTPCRLVNTRFADQGAPAMAVDETRTFQVQGNCGIPLGAKAAMLNVVSVDPTGPGHFRLYPSGTPLPPASALNFHPSQGNLANGIVVALSTQANDLAVTCMVSSTHLVVDVFGYFQ